MPQLTRDQKKRRDARRSQIFTLAQSVKTQNSTQPQTEPVSLSASSFYKFRTDATVKNEEHINDYPFIKHDIIKITIFTIGAFTLQGMLYFLLQGR